MRSKSLMLAAAVLGLLHSFWLSNQADIPNLAIKFDFQGNPVCWMSIQTVGLMSFAVYLLLTGIFLLIGALIRKFPAMMSLPEKSFWLNAENQSTTLSYVESWMYFQGTLILLFFVASWQAILEANRRTSVSLPVWFWAVFGGYLLVTVWSSLNYYRKFSKKA